MRFSMKFGSYSEGCESFSRGEVEDYTVSFDGSTGKSGLIRNTSTKNLTENQSINVYPNPVDERLFVDIKGWEGQKIIRLFDLTGRTILMKTVSEDKLEIDVSILPKGLYLLDVSDGVVRKQRKKRIQKILNNVPP